MKKISMLVLLFSFIGLAGYSQFEIGGEFQHNFSRSSSNIVSGSFENYLGKQSFNFGISYNLPSKKEDGGLSLFGGLRYSFGNSMKVNATGNVMAGGRLAYALRESKLSATIETGYHAIFNQRGFATPSLGLGYDLSLSKENSDEREMPWLFTRLSAGYRF